MLNTVRKIGPVLELFTPQRPVWRLTDIADALQMPKSTAHSLLASLVEIGLLSTTEQSQYRLGWHIVTLAERLQVSLDFRQRAEPLMQELAVDLRETVFLSVLDRHQVLYVARADGSHPTVRLAGAKVGTRLPAHCTAAGKVLLAEREEREIRDLISVVGLRQLTSKSIGSLESLNRGLAEVRRGGVAYDRGEAAPDVACIAAPIRDPFGSVIAAMSVSVPTYRFDGAEERVRKALVLSAERVSARISATPTTGIDQLRRVEEPSEHAVSQRAGRDVPHQGREPEAVA